MFSLKFPAEPDDIFSRIEELRGVEEKPLDFAEYWGFFQKTFSHLATERSKI